MKKILRFTVYNPEMPTRPEMRCATFEFNPNSNHIALGKTFVAAVIEGVRQDPERGALLVSLIISCSEIIKIEFPEVAAKVRSAVIEAIKKKNDDGE